MGLNACVFLFGWGKHCLFQPKLDVGWLGSSCPQPKAQMVCALAHFVDVV
ncbi:hypothetical protein SLEP1_g40901 [Rubroshorea leprosula]|uniref:Uncharacterized protein n=1 Tax=Rubroshorea leprosula TaxID=152421 RepID=A0AAV5L5D0_9ROSI|nr:hypothetical protein SLEP1_g40901 [Rubroshorea leprosula]